MTDDAANGTPARKRKKGPVRRVRRWVSTEKPLSHALVVVVVVGLVVAFIAWVVVSWILGQGLPWTSSTDQTSRLDITKLALTVVGGAGAFVALTVAYRRQKDIEDGRFTERFGAAAAQLGAVTPAERLAGVYAMAGVADRYTAFAQQCIDVLCGYLRLPFDPDPSKTKLTQTVSHLTTNAADGTPSTEDLTYQHLPNDREIRETIVRVIAAHVQVDRDIGWHEYDFDLTGAVLTTAPFANSTFRGRVDCSRTTFTCNASFVGVTFTRDVTFDGATFTGGAAFVEATFTGDASFSEVTFTRNASFNGATFTRETWFVGVTFTRDVTFDGATFTRGASFVETTFGASSATRMASFVRATFTGGAAFVGATFPLTVWFDGATITGGLVRIDHSIERPLPDDAPRPLNPMPTPPDQPPPDELS